MQGFIHHMKIEDIKTNDHLSEAHISLKQIPLLGTRISQSLHIPETEAAIYLLEALRFLDLVDIAEKKPPPLKLMTSGMNLFYLPAITQTTA